MKNLQAQLNKNREEFEKVYPPYHDHSHGINTDIPSAKHSDYLSFLDSSSLSLLEALDKDLEEIKKNREYELNGAKTIYELGRDNYNQAISDIQTTLREIYKKRITYENNKI